MDLSESRASSRRKVVSLINMLMNFTKSASSREALIRVERGTLIRVEMGSN